LKELPIHYAIDSSILCIAVNRFFEKFSRQTKNNLFFSGTFHSDNPYIALTLFTGYYNIFVFSKIMSVPLGICSLIQSVFNSPI
jgi:hypothetical protein